VGEESVDTPTFSDSASFRMLKRRIDTPIIVASFDIMLNLTLTDFIVPQCER